MQKRSPYRETGQPVLKGARGGVTHYILYFIDL